MPHSHAAAVRLDRWSSLFLVQLTSTLRFGWHWLLVVGALFPLFLLFVFQAIVPSRDPALLIQLFAGNIILSLLFSTLSKTALAVSYLRQTDSLDYFATLPITKGDLIAAMMATFLLQGLPPVLMLLWAGRSVLGLPLSPSFLFVLLLPLASLSMAAIGTIVGIVCRDVLSARAAGQVCIVVMLTLSPVLLPADRLPPLVSAVAYLLPSTYAVAILRDALVGHVTPATWGAVVVLALFDLVLIVCVNRYLRWQGR